MLCGRRIRVELSTGKSRHEKGRYGGGGRGGSGGDPYPRRSRESPPDFRGSRRPDPYARGADSRGSDRFSRRRYSRYSWPSKWFVFQDKIHNQFDRSTCYWMFFLQVHSLFELFSCYSDQSFLIFEMFFLYLSERHVICCLECWLSTQGWPGTESIDQL